MPSYQRHERTLCRRVSGMSGHAPLQCFGEDRFAVRWTQARTAENVADVSDFEALTRRLQDAVLRQSRPILEELVGSDFRLITSRAGNPVSRADWITMAVGPFKVRSYQLSDFHVIEAGDAAVVIHRNTQDAVLGDRQAAREWLTTDVWSKHTGRWQIMARHSEALAE